MLTFRTESLETIRTDLIVIPVCEDQPAGNGGTAGRLIHQAVVYPEFTGKSGDKLVLYRMEEIKALRVLFIGLGKTEKADAEAFRAFGGKAVRHAIDAGLDSILICIPDARLYGIDASVMTRAVMEGALLGNDLFDLYQGEKKKKPLKTIEIHADAHTAQEYGGLAEEVDIICKGTIMARQWVSMPPNEKRPDRFARSITKAAEKTDIDITLLDEKDLKKNKMLAMLAVGSGSEVRPRMVIMDYRPKGHDKTVVLVGKGVTFDSGGINLKPGGSLEDMKQDMAGAAAVGATLITAAGLGLGHRIVGLLPLVENMPSGTAFRPGDIVRTAEGKTVEIGNTDAEGRLILADAISYGVRQYNPDALMDMATLTGACVVALGQSIAGLFSFDGQLSDSITAAGRRTHERCWQMPMPEDYREMLKSDFADLRNVGKNRWGGAIAAALFLSEFAGKTPWAHIDIAGPAYTNKAGAYCGVGGTGFGVRLLTEVLQNF